MCNAPSICVAIGEEFKYVVHMMWLLLSLKYVVHMMWLLFQDNLLIFLLFITLRAPAIC